MTQVQGVVEKVLTRNTARGTAYNIVVNGTLYGGGFKHPGVQGGESVSFMATQNDRGYWNVGSPIQVIGGGQAPAQPQGQPAPQRQQRPQNQGQQGGKDDYWKAKEQRDVVNQQVIQYQSSRNSAIAAVSCALQNDALSLPQKKGERLDALLDIIDEVTERYQHRADVISGRKKDVPEADVAFEQEQEHDFFSGV